MSTVLWAFADGESMERCTLLETPSGARLEGTVLALLEGEPAEVRYRVATDSTWRTREVTVALAGGASLELLGDGEGGWGGEGIDPVALAGCIDIDIEVTPATNTLPIRRLALVQGEERAVPAAWVRVPPLTVERLDQTYLRTGPDSYRYRSGDFEAELVVDELGLVQSYGSYWNRVR